MLCVVFEKGVTIVRRVALMDAALRAALAFRSVGGVVPCDHAGDEHGRLAAIVGTRGEQAKGNDGREK